MNWIQRASMGVLCVGALPGCTGLQYFPTEDKTSTPGTDTTDVGVGDDDDDDNTTNTYSGYYTDTGTPSTWTTTTTTTTTTPYTTTTTPTTTTTTPTTSTTLTGNLAITSVTPDYGPSLGGTRVTVEGSFDASTELWFGGTAGTIVTGDATTIEADTPPGVTGWVDVQAVSGASSATLVDGYQYWLDGTGLGGSLGWLSYVESVGGFWVDGSAQAVGAIAFNSPSPWHLWQDYAPAQGTCAFEFPPAALPLLYDPGAPYVDLADATGLTTARLPPDPKLPGSYASALVPNIDVVPGTTYDLEPIAGDADWPGFGIVDYLEVPAAFSVTSPALDQPTDPVDVTETFTLTWNGSGGDYVLLYILREGIYYYGSPYYGYTGTWVLDGYVTCAVPDTGSFTMPAGTWPTWYPGAFLHIQVGRVIESSAIHPHDNSEVRAAGVYWIYGGADTI